MQIAQKVEKQFRYKIQHLRYLTRKVKTVPTAYRIVYSNPNNVHYYLKESSKTDRVTSDGRGQFDRRKNVGKVLSGSWDQRKEDFKNLKLYRSFHQVFVKEEDWEETPFIKAALEDINKGEIVYGCNTKTELLQSRVQYIENLYKDIKENGYRRQGKNPDDNRDRGKSHEGILHEVNISIGRNGELLFNNTAGHNRLSIAKILELNEIPMTIIVRHKQWQEMRKEVYSANSFSQLCEKTKTVLDHPDIRSLHDFTHNIN